MYFGSSGYSVPERNKEYEYMIFFKKKRTKQNKEKWHVMD